MRTVAACLTFILVAGLMGGRADSAADPAPAGPATRPDRAAGSQACAMRSGDVSVLQVTVPADAKFAAADGSLRVSGPHCEVEVWLARGATTVDEAVGHVRAQIVDEFKDFKAGRTTDMTVAGSAAKRLVGAGHEADDGDAGEADVIVFQVGGHVFVACTHGESLDPAGRQGLSTLVQSARVP